MKAELKTVSGSLEITLIPENLVEDFAAQQASAYGDIRLTVRCFIDTPDEPLRVGPGYQIPAHAPSMTDCIEKAKMIGGSAEDGEAFFNHYERQGWVLGSGIPMANWQSGLACWLKEGRAREQEGPNGARTVLLGKELERVDKDMALISGTYGGMQSWSGDDRARYRVLNDKRKELRKELDLE